MKYCTKCKETKLLEGFSKSKSERDGYNGHCKECIKIAKADWKRRNYEREREKSRLYTAWYRKTYPEKVAESYSDWAMKNRPLLNERDRRRNAKKKNATPVWASVEVMRVIYGLAEKKTKVTGIEHQVDHIVPLNSDFVCGLHVEWNLQVLTKPENGSKGNHWWPDMWDE